MTYDPSMALTHPGSFRLFQAFGVDVHIHWSWFVVAVIQLQWFRDAFYGPYWHVLLYLSLFGIVLLHEFGHALACRSVGGMANHIVLWPLGGIAFVQPPQRPGAVLWSIAAGPLVNVVLMPLLLGLMFVTGATGQASAMTDLQLYVMLLASINFALLVFNILPIYPLDGGQILQAILWFFMGRAKSLAITAGFGMLVAVVAAFPLIYLGRWWLLLLCGFVGWQAYNGLRYARALAILEAQQRPHPEPWRM